MHHPLKHISINSHLGTTNHVSQSVQTFLYQLVAGVFKRGNSPHCHTALEQASLALAFSGKGFVFLDPKSFQSGGGGGELTALIHLF